MFLGIQPSLGVRRGLVIGSPMNTKTCERSSPLYKMAYYAQPSVSVGSVNSTYHGYGAPTVLTLLLFLTHAKFIPNS